MMADLKKQIADAFNFHWDQYVAEGQPIPLSQVQLAQKLQDLGYLNNEMAYSNNLEFINTPSDQHVANNKRFYEHHWITAPIEFKAWLISQLGSVDGKHQLNKTTSQIDLCNLEWYESYKLIRVTDSLWENSELHLYYLISPEKNLFRLNGTSPPIHEVNKRAPIKLSKNNVLSYLIFFTFFVRGDKGAFYILESMDDPIVEKLRNARPSDQSMIATRKIIEGVIRPLTFEGINEQGHYLCDAVISYSNAMFIASFAVHLDGMVEMLNDEPIAANMLFKIDAPLA